MELINRTKMAVVVVIFPEIVFLDPRETAYTGSGSTLPHSFLSISEFLVKFYIGKTCFKENRRVRLSR